MSTKGFQCLPVRGLTAAGLTLACLCVTAHAAAQEMAPPAAPGVHKLVLQPRDRRYTVIVPASYDGQKPVPLVFALHFGARVIPPYLGGEFLTGFIYPALQQLDAIMVAPDCTGVSWSDARSEKDVIELFAYIRKHYAIDDARTLITGYSMGGSGTWRLAARHQDLFRAALIMAGQPESATAKVEWKIPIYVIHSRRDEIIPIKPAENVVGKLKTKGINVHFEALDAITHYDTNGFIVPLQNAVPWIKEAWR